MAKKSPAFENVEKDWTLGETLQQYPETMEVFAKFGMHCIGCAISMHETIEQGAKAHGIDVVKLLKVLNEAIAKERGGE